MRPPIKYVGGKGKLVDEISKYMLKETSVIVEPFCGSAAYSFSKEIPFYLVDKSPELINLLQVMRNFDTFKRLCKLLEQFEESHGKEFYMDVRATDRQKGFSELPKVYRAARYFYIIYAGYNGLYRVNKKNQCNTPWGHRKFKYDGIHLLRCHEHLNRYCKGIFFQEFDDMGIYESMLDSGEKPFVLIDPPYYGDGVFKAYTPEQDGGDFYYRLSQFIDKLENADIPFLMTNTYCDYIKDLFYEYGIEKVSTKYTVAADGTRRGEKFEAFVHNANIDKLVEEGTLT